MKHIFRFVDYYISLLIKNLHKNALPTLVMILCAFAYCRCPIIGQLARLLCPIYAASYMYQRIWRFLSQSKFKPETVLKDVTEFLLSHLENKSTRLIQISLDWTKVGVFKILMGIIPVRGRGKPIYYKLWESYDLKDRMTGLEKELIEEILSVVPQQLRYKIVFVSDRGFAKIELIKLIEQLGAKWIIRFPKNVLIRVNKKLKEVKKGGWIKVCEIPIKEGEMKFYKGIIVTKKEKIKVNMVYMLAHEWEVKHEEDKLFVLMSNLEDAKEIIKQYAKRMKIEQVFKDMKKRGLNVEQILIQNCACAKKMFLIVMLYYLIMILLWWQRIRKDNEFIRRIMGKGKFNKLSIFCLSKSYLDEQILWTMSEQQRQQICNVFRLRKNLKISGGDAHEAR